GPVRTLPRQAGESRRLVLGVGRKDVSSNGFSRRPTMRSDPVFPEPAEPLTDCVQIQRRTLLALVLAAPSLAWATHALAGEASIPAADDRFLALSRFATG